MTFLEKKFEIFLLELSIQSSLDNLLRILKKVKFEVFCSSF
jgi:hypothetical protein